MKSGLRFYHDADAGCWLLQRCERLRPDDIDMRDEFALTDAELAALNDELRRANGVTQPLIVEPAGRVQFLPDDYREVLAAPHAGFLTTGILTAAPGE